MSSSSEEQFDPGSRSILVVDDDRCVLESMVEILQEEGYQVNGVQSALQVLQMVEVDNAQPDLLLLDYQIGGAMNGLDLLDRLCKSRRLRVIMISGNLPEAELAKRNIPGLSKPCDINQLLLLVSQTLHPGDITSQKNFRRSTPT
jgi:CheY-like chemotaxis protein